ncbi:MAG: IS630 family transposase [Cenarchaeum sp. SB0661_bin_35]|nr:IS630 family transposase [Cenarchaeum sp. SB0661_bin_35]
MIGGWNGYSWLPKGGRETSPVSWSKKSVRLIGVLADGWFCIAIIDATNSETLKNFLDTIRADIGKAAMIMDNASYHKSEETDKYLNDSDGMFECIFLPAYTPQLNPIEVLWRDLKRALAGSYESIDDLKKAITDIVNSGELQPPKLFGYMLPDGIPPSKPVPCTIQDLTTPESKTEAAA